MTTPQCTCTPDEYGHLLHCAVLWAPFDWTLTDNGDGTATARPNHAE